MVYEKEKGRYQGPWLLNSQNCTVLSLVSKKSKNLAVAISSFQQPHKSKYGEVPALGKME